MAAEAHPDFWVRLPFSARSAGEARRQFAAWVSEHDGVLADDADRRYEAQLVLTELVGNSVRHADPLPDGTVEVGWAQGSEGLDIAVRDGGGPEVPQVRQAEPMATEGRGLAVVSALAGSWWVDRTGERTTTHAVLPLHDW